MQNCLPNNNAEFLGGTNKTVNFKREVNSFLGWAISSVHASLLKALLELDTFDDRADVTEKSVQAKLDFVGTMRYFHHEAKLNETYMRDCYDGTHRFMNCGGLALVSPQHYEFGKSLMQVIVDALDEKDFDEHGSQAVQKGWACIEESMDSLKAQFLECGKNFTGLGEDIKIRMLKILVEKTRNARFGAEVKARRDKKTKRGGKNHVGMTHRGLLKSTKEGSKVNKEFKIKDEE